MTSIRDSVEEKYNDIFSVSHGKRHANGSKEEILAAFTSKRKSLRFKTLADLSELKSNISARVESGEPIKVCVIWGYGKDGFCFREHDPEWYKPDMADVFTLGVISTIIKSVRHPLEVTISYSTSRYLNANYYHIGRKPEQWLEEGLHNFSKEFEKLCSSLLPSVGVHDCYKLNEKAGIDMDYEMDKEYVEEEYKRIKNEQRFMDMYSHVQKHSSNPSKSLERYAKERIVELKCGVPNADIMIYFSGNVFGSIRYHTTVNRKFPDIIPPWAAKGSVVVLGKEWYERMVSHHRMHEMNGERRVEKFNILGKSVKGLIYES
jgi:hypothetical protein